MNNFINVRFLTMVTLVIITAIVGKLAYDLGAFEEVKIKQQEVPELIVLYKEHLGPYHEVLGDLEEVEKFAKQNGIKCSKTFGQYFDDPESKPAAELKAHVGCVVGKLGEDSESFRYKTIPGGEFVTARFTGSPAIGPVKVYPEVEDWMGAKGLAMSPPIIEVYEVLSKQNMVTSYRFPIRSN